ncbi:MAG: cobalamin-binding protein [bacterium]
MRATLATLCWCAAQATPASAQISVTDDAGRVVTLAQPARRIVSLAPHNTENLFTAGAGARIVAVGDHSDYPPQARQLPRVGSHAQINLEALLAYQPDLVVAWQTNTALHDALARIEQWGIAVYYSEPRDFDDIIANIEELALLAGTTRIEPSPARLRETLARTRARFADAREQSVFYQVWSEPLITLNGDHYLSRALEICGARNAFAHLPFIAPRVSVEAVVQANPDIIITGAIPNDDDDATADFARWRKWSSLDAVANDALIAVDSNAMHRHTARMILGVEKLCEQIDRVRRN